MFIWKNEEFTLIKNQNKTEKNCMFIWKNEEFIAGRISIIFILR